MFEIHARAVTTSAMRRYAVLFQETNRRFKFQKRSQLFIRTIKRPASSRSVAATQIVALCDPCLRYSPKSIRLS